MVDNKPREERRNHVRLKKDLPVQLVFRFTQEDNKESPVQEALILNISASGVCVEMEAFDETQKDDLLFGRSIIVLKITFPGKEEPVSILAKAVWITKTEGMTHAEDKTVKYLMGARFIEITSEEEKAIMNYIVNYFL